jgi:hypothetical protein
LAARQAEEATRGSGSSPGAFQELVVELGLTPSKDSTRRGHPPLAGRSHQGQSPVPSTGKQGPSICTGIPA